MELCLQKRMECQVSAWVLGSTAGAVRCLRCELPQTSESWTLDVTQRGNCSVISTHLTPKPFGCFQAMIPLSFQWGREVSESHQEPPFEDLAVREDWNCHMPFPVMQTSYCRRHKSLTLHWNLSHSAFCFTLLMPLRSGRTVRMCHTFVWPTVFLLCWQMLWWKTLQEIRKALLHDFFPPSLIFAC